MKKSESSTIKITLKESNLIVNSIARCFSDCDDETLILQLFNLEDNIMSRFKPERKRSMELMRDINKIKDLKDKSRSEITTLHDLIDRINQVLDVEKEITIPELNYDKLKPYMDYACHKAFQPIIN